MKHLLFPISFIAVLLSACSSQSTQREKSVFSELTDTLSDTMYIAELDLCVPILLVTDGVFSAEQDIDAAIGAEVYTLDSLGRVIDLGEIRSQGTAYPLKAKGGSLYTTGHHYVYEYRIINGELVCVNCLVEKFLAPDDPIYIRYDDYCVEHEISYSTYDSLCNVAFDAPIISFTAAGKE